ncbi:receptor protein kinase-like protein ZAR1 [Gastrolobium bilobum]|uniref:receptor protein kinase-like protein ZAR1 n=1 Tax=Gastrolobium bilobum TaxID=150636 RepID=UPI002AAF5833|nr:receptor protein kinase-like protein ZAR1 [Gastrolobium bilobum]
MMLLQLLHVISCCLFFFLLLPFTLSLNSDGLSLLALKAAIEVDPTGVLNSWSDSVQSPCEWFGVVCTGERVTQLALPAKGLSGYIPSELGHLTELKKLNLQHNNFSSGIPSSLFNATNLMALDLSSNSLCGSLPSTIASLKNLIHLDLSSNFLNGSIPDSFSELVNLVGALNLSHNRFSGGVPASLGMLPVAVSLDLRGNNLTGEIPQVGSLLNQGPTAFAGNPGLCGFPLQNACPEEKSPEIFPSTRDDPNLNPNPKPKALYPRGASEEKVRGGSFVVGGVISGVLLMSVAVLLSVWVFRRRRRWEAGEGEIGKKKVEGEVGVGEEQKGRFVVVDEGFGLELEDLLRGSAYVVGKSRSGIVYKVVGKGSFSTAAAAVAVRRLSEGDVTWRFKEFESEVAAIGRVRHPNVVPLRAYYYANDEKLLITDFIRNGSLYTALHGGPSNSLPPLSWAARLKIAQGTARGLMYIHEFNGRKYVHGNLKPTKILLDDDLHPCITGFGLTRLGLGTSKFAPLVPKRQNSNQSTLTSAMGSKVSVSSNNYLAPEVRIAGGKFTQKCDVYSFGIVLLELLTGRLPDLGPENDGKELESFVRRAFKEEKPLLEILDPALLPEVYAKKQVIAAFHVALNCTEHDPEMRPRMRTVSESLDCINIQ